MKPTSSRPVSAKNNRPTRTNKVNNTNNRRTILSRNSNRAHTRYSTITSHICHSTDLNLTHNTSSRTFSSTSRSKPKLDNMASKLQIFTKDQPTLPAFDMVVVGGGSGGMATARRAASYGAKVAVIEHGKLGGTCVNVGCIPKKLMYLAANVSHDMDAALDYGYDIITPSTSSTSTDTENKTELNYVYNWNKMKNKRDAYITRLNGIYYRNLMREGVYLIRGTASFDIDSITNKPVFNTINVAPSPYPQDSSDDHVVDVDISQYTGREVIIDPQHPITIHLDQDTHTPASYKGSSIKQRSSDDVISPNTIDTNFLLLAPGGYPTPSPITHGGDYVMTSDDFFHIKYQPRRTLMIGGGYIAVELSQVLALLHTSVTMVLRSQNVLAPFDHDLQSIVMSELHKQCDTIHQYTEISRIVKLSAEEIKNKQLSNERPYTPDETISLSTPKHPNEDITRNINIYGVYATVNKKVTSEYIDTLHTKGLIPTNITSIDDCIKHEIFLGYYDSIFSAIGRTPATKIMNIPLETVSGDTIMTNSQHIIVDDMGLVVPTQHTRNILAVGDIQGKSDLTPVAINVGRRLSDWVFGGKQPLPLHLSRRTDDPRGKSSIELQYEHNNKNNNNTNTIIDPNEIIAHIPTVVFSHPPIGTVGYTEKEAIDKYGKERIKVYRSRFTDTSGALLDPEHKTMSVTKMITLKPPGVDNTTSDQEIVIGVHVISPGADEMIQGFAIPVVNGLPKSMVDQVVAIHPTVSEELVLLR